MTENEQAQQKVAMVIVAHADDAEFGAGGTVASWVQDGWDVYYVVCTDGGGGGPDEATDVSQTARERIIETRVREQRAAGAVLGLKDVIFLGYPDGQLEPTLELRQQLVRMMRRYQPARIVCQSPDFTWTSQLAIRRYHPDHMAAGRATLEAVYPASQNPWAFPQLFEEEGLKPHKVSEIYIMGAPVVNYGVDITSTIEKKCAALQGHDSQLGDHISELETRLRGWAGEVGKKYGYSYAEEFHRTENN